MIHILRLARYFQLESQEGDLSIYVKDKKLNINWSVKLDILYFGSCLIGIAFGFTVSLYFDFTLLQTILSGLAAAIILVIIGVIAIMVKIDELNQVYLEGLLKSKQAT
jgi:tetrahydromethanopterin S-methyltransferase subunit E